MKSLTIIFILFFGLNSDKLDCSDLKNGKFQTINEDGSITVITRKDNKQIENFKNGERISEFDVQWTSDCEYLILNRKVVKGNDPWPQMNKDTLRILITEIQNEYYLTESEMLSKGWKMQQKVKILK